MDIESQINSLVASATQLQGVGKMISKKNMDKLKQAITALADLVDAASKEEEMEMACSRVYFEGGMIRFERGRD